MASDALGNEAGTVSTATARTAKAGTVSTVKASSATGGTTKASTTSTSTKAESIDVLRRRVQELKLKPQPVQRSKEWYSARQTKVTASEAASCLTLSEQATKTYVEEFGLQNGFKYSAKKCANPYASKDAYIKKKCHEFFSENGSTFKDTIFTLWGKKYEEVANRSYCLDKNVDVHEFGLISHDTLEWLAASPDGITTDGVMLEIKCPKSRKITGVPPLYYWVQVQIQLEVCDLEECDFVECEIEELEYDAWKDRRPEPGRQDKGIIVEAEDADGHCTYVYPPPRQAFTDDEFVQWAKSNVPARASCCISDSDSDGSDRSDGGDKQYRIVYYFVTKYNVVTIKRSKSWFQAVSGDIYEVWKQFREIQNSKTLYAELKSPQKKEEIQEKEMQATCFIDD